MNAWAQMLALFKFDPNQPRNPDGTWGDGGGGGGDDGPAAGGVPTDRAIRRAVEGAELMGQVTRVYKPRIDSIDDLMVTEPSQFEPRDELVKRYKDKWPVDPPVVENTTGRIIDGHHRIASAKAAGFTKIFVVPVAIKKKNAWAEMLVLFKAFDPDQPRDDHGQWTDGGSDFSDGGEANRTIAIRTIQALSKDGDDNVDMDELVRVDERLPKVPRRLRGEDDEFIDVARKHGVVETFQPHEQTWTATQSDISVNGVVDKINSYDSWAQRTDVSDPVMLFKQRGTRFALDGHHRLIAAKLLKAPLKVLFIDLDKDKNLFAWFETKGPQKPKKKPLPKKWEAKIDSFDWAAWQRRTRNVYEGEYRGIVIERGKRAAAEAQGPWKVDDPFMQREMTEYVGDRIVQLDEFSREDISDLVRNWLARTPDEAGSMKELANLITEKYDGYAQWRADRIARTETAIAYNHGTVFGYRQAGVTEVEVLDGDGDEACAAANGQVWPLARALKEPVEHPNCTRDFVPIKDDEE